MTLLLTEDDGEDSTRAEDAPSSAPSSESSASEEPSAEAPSDDPTITARAFLDSLLEGDCLAVEGLSTPDYFSTEFGDQEGCSNAAGDLEMSNADYDFEEPVTAGGIATVNGDVVAPSTGATLDSTWILDGSTGDWLVSGHTYVKK